MPKYYFNAFNLIQLKHAKIFFQSEMNFDHLFLESYVVELLYRLHVFPASELCYKGLGQPSSFY